MRRLARGLRVLLLAALLGMPALPNQALAQSPESLRGAVADYYERLNNEDPSFADRWRADATSFPRTGALLGPANDRATAAANFNAGLNFNVTLHHLDAVVLGNVGIVTYYTAGTTDYPTGETLEGFYRASIVATWEGNEWRWTHAHLSELQQE